mgnify:CR=1 FL=1|jgi:hypothetical protein
MDVKEWRNRIVRRSDFSCDLTHLTKANGKNSSLDVLVKILKDKKLVGGSGFVCDYKPVVCFQDIPLSSLSENILYEQLLHKQNPKQPCRYDAFGLRFSKTYVYKKGGRPVIYEATKTAKEFLPKNEYWRIVKLDLSDDKNVVDWTHEREWRVKGNLEFEWSDVEIILSQEHSLQQFIKKCKENNIEGVLDEVKGIITLKSLIF